MSEPIVTHQSTTYDSRDTLAVPVDPTPAVAVVTPIAEPVATERVVERTSWRSVSFEAVLAGSAGVALLVIGLLALTRAGLDSTLTDPAVEVAGFGHTALLGGMEALMGVFLIASAAARSRSGAMFFGVVLFVFGLVGALQTTSFERNLALESSWAWLLALVGAAVALAAMFVPRYVDRRTSYRTA